MQETLTFVARIRAAMKMRSGCRVLPNTRGSRCDLARRRYVSEIKSADIFVREGMATERMKSLSRAFLLAERLRPSLLVGGINCATRAACEWGAESECGREENGSYCFQYLHKFLESSRRAAGDSPSKVAPVFSGGWYSKFTGGAVDKPFYEG